MNKSFFLRKPLGRYGVVHLSGTIPRYCWLSLNENAVCALVTYILHTLLQKVCRADEINCFSVWNVL
jgi:hypothetical protein